MYCRINRSKHTIPVAGVCVGLRQNVCTEDTANVPPPPSPPVRPSHLACLRSLPSLPVTTRASSWTLRTVIQDENCVEFDLTQVQVPEGEREAATDVTVSIWVSQQPK